MNPLPLKNLIADSDTRPFGQVLSALGVRETSMKEGYAGVTMNTDKQVTLLLSVELWPTLSKDEQLFVLAHEASHILCNHLGRMSQNVNRTIYNYASDAVINSILLHYYKDYFKMPEGVITLELLKEKEWIKSDSIENATVEKVYRELMNNPNIKKLLDFLRSLTSLDQHCDLTNMDPTLKRLLDDIIKDAKSAPGSIAGNTLRRLGEIYSKYFPFESVLRKILEREKYDFSRPNRRVKIEGSFVPRRKVPKFKVYAAIDISGSCYNYSEQFLSYIKSLPEFEEVDFFDTDIRSTMKRGGAQPADLSGYGGTDVSPVMEKWERLEGRNTSTSQLNFILLTDGEVPKFHYSPKKSNVVVFTTNEEVHASNGRQWLNIHI